MNDYVTPPSEERPNDKAKQLYEMGKQLCEMAEAMGYSESEEGEEEDDIMVPVKKKSKPSPRMKSKVDTAMSFFGE